MCIYILGRVRYAPRWEARDFWPCDRRHGPVFYEKKGLVVVGRGEKDGRSGLGRWRSQEEGLDLKCLAAFRPEVIIEDCGEMKSKST